MKPTRPAFALSLAVLAISSTPGASAGVGMRSSEPPRTPEQVRADFAANARSPGVREYRRVTPQEAMTKPFAGGETGEAETAERLPNSISAATSEGAEGGNACWYVALSNGLGIFPYERTHHAATYWCAVYGQYLTYRRTNTRGDTNGFCSTTGTGSWKMGGGVYHRWVKVHTWSSFSCPTPWWWALHDTLWMNIAYNAWGSYAVEERYP